MSYENQPRKPRFIATVLGKSLAITAGIFLGLVLLYGFGQLILTGGDEGREPPIIIPGPMPMPGDDYQPEFPSVPRPIEGPSSPGW